jgi:hypothetical protein
MSQFSIPAAPQHNGQQFHRSGPKVQAVPTPPTTSSAMHHQTEHVPATADFFSRRVLFLQFAQPFEGVLFHVPVMTLPARVCFRADPEGAAGFLHVFASRSFLMISSGVCRFLFMSVGRRSRAANSHNSWLNLRGALHYFLKKKTAQNWKSVRCLSSDLANQMAKQGITTNPLNKI